MNSYKQYLKNKGLKNSSIKNYTWHIEQFLDWLGQESLSQAKLKEYFDYLLSRYPRVNTINLRLKILNDYLNFLGKKFRFDLLSEESITPKILSPAQLEKFLENTNTGNSLLKLRNRSLIEILYYSGLKVGQLINLQKSQIDAINQEILIAKNIKISLSPSIWKNLQEYLTKRNDDSNFLFINFDRSQKSKDSRLSVRSVERLIDKYSKNISPAVKVNPQILRNTLAYQMKLDGARSQEIKASLHFKTKSGAKKYFKNL